jgi:hypothetical protein
MCPSIAQGAVKDDLAVVRPSELKGYSRSGNGEIKTFFKFIACSNIDRICLKDTRRARIGGVPGILSQAFTTRKPTIKWFAG